jgi:hypothetical protein
MFLSILVASVVLGSPIPERGTFHGETAVEASGSAIAIYVDTNRDASFDERFVLEFESVDPPNPEADTKRERELDDFGGGDGIADREIPAPLYFENATIEFAPGYVRVSAGAEAFELFVEGTQSATWNPSGARVWRRAGYGLTRHDYESGIAISRPNRTRSITSEFCDASTACDPDPTDGGGGSNGGGTLCDAGGPGSTSCSVTSHALTCTSSCGSGYYSCCMYGSPPKCRCIRGA